MGRFLGSQKGSVAITVFDMGITEHAEKFAAFESTLKSFYPNLSLLKPVEDHDVEKEAYKKTRKLLDEHADLAGIYVTTEASIPVLKAAHDAGRLERLTVITTDLYADLVPYIRSGAVVSTIYQRPRAQGQMALRMLHEFLAEGSRRSHQVALAPHLVMRGNLDFFLRRQSEESSKERTPVRESTRHLIEDFA
jgi:LacI family transcriptional regulator